MSLKLTGKNLKTVFNISGRMQTALAIIFVCAAALYFRTYQLHFLTARSSDDIRKAAIQTVLPQVAEQVKKQIKQKFPDLSKDILRKVIANNLVMAVETEYDQFQSTLQRIEKQLKHEFDNRKKENRFLLEADSYYYYFLTKQLEKKGTFVSKYKWGRFLNPNRLVPNGAWDWMTLHPYLGFFWHKIVHLLTGLELMQTLCFFSLFMTILMIALYFTVSKALKLSLFATTIGCFILVLSPVCLSRTAYGWYDTDVYNYIFPMILFWCFFSGIENRNHFKFAGFAGVISFLYAFFWMGSNFQCAVFFFCGFMSALVCWWLERKVSYNRFYFLGVYLVLWIVLVSALFSPVYLMEQLGNHLHVFNKLTGASASSAKDIWPNDLLTIGELQPSRLNDVFFMTSSWITYVLIAMGLIAFAFRFQNDDSKYRLYQWVFFLGMAVPILILTLQARRFSVFLILPISFCAALAIDDLIHWVKNPFPYAKQALTGLFAILLLFPAVLAAHQAAQSDRLIMNESWFKALSDIKRKTPEESVIDSWWPPGYFILSIAERKSVLDGGGMTLPENLWMGKALLAQDELSAIGILRMLNSSGHKAFSFLVSIGYDEESALQLILKLVRTSKVDAKQSLPPGMSGKNQEQLLEFTHGKLEPAPAYLLVYDDLIAQNMEPQVMGYWSFERAKKINLHQQFIGKGYNSDDFIKKEVAVIGGIRSYQRESETVQPQLGKLIFSNKVVIDLTLKEVFSKKPRSLFYLEGGKLIEKQFDGFQSEKESILLVPKPDGFSVVQANPDLIRSMLFRMFYLNGADLKVLKPFTIQEDLILGTKVSAFQIDWKKFEDQIKTEESVYE